MILALETATAACSVAVTRPDGTVLAETLAAAGPAHTRRLLADIHHALAMAGAALGDVELIVVGLGPGTFTGLRIGVATARALAQARGVALAGVPTLAALALALSEGDATGDAVVYVPLIDGKRREVFAAGYERSGHTAVGCLSQVRELTTLPADELGAFMAAWPAAVVGGDGADLYADQLPSAVRVCRTVRWPTAGMIARAWYAEVPGLVRSADEVLPIYGRAPDAVRWTEHRRAGAHQKADR